jgi:probable rRNA maturation factor
MEPGSSRVPAKAGTQISGRAKAASEIVVAEPRWRRFIANAEAIAGRAARTAFLHGAAPATVMLASDRAVKQLNARHRGRNKPTNVLTFEPAAPGLPGDIVLALGTVAREAAAAGRRPSHHLAHLVIHGLLHLRGHDHHHAGDARRMEMQEARLLQRMGVPNPWSRR